MRIIISKTDSIGDVILALPMCGWIKHFLPECELIFLCQKMTHAIVSRCEHVDKIVIWNGELPEADVIIHVFPNKHIAKEAKKKKVRIRIGTSHRPYHWRSCNKLINFSRIKSNLHESQLNFKLLKPLLDKQVPEIDEMCEFVGWKSKKEKFEYLVNDKFNLIFHIKSRGSAKEWAAKNYLQLAKMLDNRFNIILTGTKAEKEMILKDSPEIFLLNNVIDTTGNLSLDQLIDLIGSTDGLIACSTGPMHIAGISGIKTLGLFPNKRPMHAGRWRALGNQVQIISESMESDQKELVITTEEVFEVVNKWV